MSAPCDAKPTKASRLSTVYKLRLRDLHPTVAFTENFPHQRMGPAGGHPRTTCFPCTNGSFRSLECEFFCRGLRFHRLACRVPRKLAFINYLFVGAFPNRPGK